MMRILLAASALVALAGCENYGADFGDAVHNNVAVQSVQPNPPAVAQPVPGNGEQAQLAQQRYANDKTKQPSAMTTSNVGSFGGGAGTPAGGQ